MQPAAAGAAEPAGPDVTDVDDDLVEWDCGRHEGRATADVHAEDADWSLWTDGAPAARAPGRSASGSTGLRALMYDGDVAHGHALRVAGARWIGLTAAGGGLPRLDTATLSALGTEHARPVLHRWNAPV